jgi:hypothetical protein
MDTRLNVALIEARQVELAQRAQAPRAAREWPDDGLPARGGQRRHGALHPTAVLASLLTWR